MRHPFDELTPETLRRPTSRKWSHHPSEVLPLWIADMDFPPAEPIREALAAFVRDEHFMYATYAGIPDLYESVHDHLAKRYGWQVPTGTMQMVSGLVPGLFVAVRTLAAEGEQVLLPTPAYHPFMEAIRNTGRVEMLVPMPRTETGYELDVDALAGRLTADTRVLILCNPHNPTGRVYRREELERLAAFVLEHDLMVISDEVHADLIFEGEHIPFASLSHEIADRTITLWAASKAFNIAGLSIGFAITQNRQLRERYYALMRGAMPMPGGIGQTASVAALRRGAAWLEDTLRYLKRNRALVTELVASELPAAGYLPPQGTYFAWLDLRAYGLGEAPGDALLERARVALNCGSLTGPGGEGFVRLNFATSAPILEEAFRRLRAALPNVGAG